jgi:hypothetical protein
MKDSSLVARIGLAKYNGKTWVSGQACGHCTLQPATPRMILPPEKKSVYGTNGESGVAAG